MQAKVMILAVTPRMTAAQGFDALMRHCALDLDAGLADFAASEPVEGLHKARVALRRLTTCLDIFAPLLRDAARRDLRARAKSCFRAMGALREADVYLADWANEDERDKLRAGLKKLRARTVKDLARSGANRLSVRILKEVAKRALLGTRKSRVSFQKLPVARFAATALRPVWDRCAGFGPNLGPMAATDRHELRKALKSLRYATEFFAPVLEGPRIAELLDDLRRLQDLLGEMNDLELAKQRRPDLTRKDGATATTAAILLGQAMPLWTRFASCQPEWFAPVRADPGPTVAQALRPVLGKAVRGLSAVHKVVENSRIS